MPGVMSLAGSELVINSLCTSKLKCWLRRLFQDFLLVCLVLVWYFFPSGCSVALGVKLCANDLVWPSKAENPLCW